MVRAALRVSSRIKQQALAFLSRNWDDDTAGIDVVWILAPLAEPIPGDGLPILWSPIPDDPNGVPSYTLKQLRFWAELLQNKRVLTCCHMGENRSGLASALLLIAQGKSAQEAIDTVRAAGPPLTDNPYLLWNPGFVAQLLEDEK